MRVLIIGCGYVGAALGEKLALAGHKVVGVRRSPAGAGRLAALGIEPVVVDVTSGGGLGRIPGSFDWVINTVASPFGGGVEAYRQTYLEGTRSVLAWLERNPPRRYVYTGSTGVYGQDDGGWVDETSPTEPESPTARILVDTEHHLMQAARERGFPAIILRLAGIYGPERCYWLQQMLRGEARIPGDGTRWMNMVHRDDIVQAVMDTLERGQPGELYNVCDDEPVQHLDFFRWLAAQLGMPLPPFAAEEASTRRRRGLTNKRVSNRKLREALGYRFRHPSYREGYAQLLR